MSLKAYEPELKVCLVHDKESIAHLTEEELNLFDFLKPANESDYTIEGKKQYQRMKLCVDKYTPFKNTMYIDVDTIWFPEKNISHLFAHLKQHEFFIGFNGDYNPVTKYKTNKNYTYWGEPITICKYFKLQNNLPQTISGVFYFSQNDFTEKVFKRSLEVYNDKLAPCMQWANGKPDEYCFNIALSELNYKQDNCHFVYFDKTNGLMSREAVFQNFWGLAIGGNKLSAEIANMYNSLVIMYVEKFGFKNKRLHIDKVIQIKERRNF